MRGSGTQADPFIIEDVNDLQAMEDNLAAYYELESDIDASVTSGWNGGLGFAPIGTFANRFTGDFDGKGFTIDGLFINRPATWYVGLFGYTERPSIQNVTLSGVNIIGDEEVGALVGDIFNTGVISNCSSSGTVTSNGTVGGLVGVLDDAEINNCSSSATVISAGTPAGGLSGYASGIIQRCFATGRVSGLSTIGGLVGHGQSCEIISSYAIGNVSGLNDVGGLIGRSQGNATIRDSYARGNVTATGVRVGGFIGRNPSPSLIDNCYSTGIPSGAGNVGGFCGQNTGTITDSFWDTEASGTLVSDGGTGRTTAQMKTRSTFINAGWNFASIWFIGTRYNDGYPCFQGVPTYPYTPPGGGRISAPGPTPPPGSSPIPTAYAPVVATLAATGIT